MKRFYFLSKGKKLSAVLNGNNKSAIIILAHGWTSSKDGKSCILLEKTFNKIGIDTLRFDFYGHGESEGRLEDMTISIGVKNVIDAVKYAKKSGYKNIGLFGSSFGGLCSTLAAAKIKLFVLLLKSPVSDYRDIKWEKRGEGFMREHKKYNAYKLAKKINCPVLIIHGIIDKDVPISQSEKLRKSLKNCKLIEVAGLTHDYTDEQLKFMAKNSVEFLGRIKV